MKALIVSVLLYLGIISPTPHIVTGAYDPGGNVGTYIMWYERVKEAGLTVEVDGACISACSLVFILPPEKVCITENAKFGLHLASDENGPNLALTAQLVQIFYPTIVKDWIEKNGPLVAEPIYMYPEDLKGYFKMCGEEAA
jgi:hypothetical protein